MNATDRAARDEAQREEWIARQLAARPPMTEERRRRLQVLFTSRPSTRERAS